MVTSRSGTNGTTSVAPIRGCSPVWRERSIRSVATRMAASAASTLASGGATNVNTERLWAASAWTSSSLTPGTLVTIEALRLALTSVHGAVVGRIGLDVEQPDAGDTGERQA